MKSKIINIIKLFPSLCLFFLVTGCDNSGSQKNETKAPAISSESSKTNAPSDVIPFMDKFKILLGDGTHENNLIGFKDDDFFYTAKEGDSEWVVYKTPNSGVTSKNSSNTRTELHEKREWVPETGGKLTGTLKVKHVSTSGDARSAASYSVVIGQIHSGEGHENEPFKLFYKKFPGHEKGSVFWNYEINTKGKNEGRWDFSEAIWGYDMFVVGDAPKNYPSEPKDGIKLDEELSYEVNVYDGIMYLTFKSKGHPTKTFTKNLIKTEYSTLADMPAQTKKNFLSIGRDGVERTEAYSNEKMYFKQGAYNQTNGKDPKSNIIWCTGADTYEGNIAKQYAHGDYTEVWFKEATVSLAQSVK